MRVLITGVSGFVGRHLAESLVERGDTVIGTILGDAPSSFVGIDTVELDVRNAPGMARLVERVAPDLVFHLAGLTHVGQSWKQTAEYYQVNVEGTRNVIAASSGRRLVFTSSAEVYGRVPESEQPIPESRAVAPRSPYALTKAAAELLVERAGGRILRLFNLVGPGQSEQFALPSFARQLKAISIGEAAPPLEVGNLAARRDFCHVSDASAGLLCVADRGDDGTVYNLGSGEAISIRQALDLLMDVAGTRVDVAVDSERLRPVDVPLLRANADRLRGLGWSPQRDLRQAMAELWASVGD